MRITLRIPLCPFLVAVACIAIASAAAAQPPTDRDPVEMLKRADTDGDGKVNREEFIKARTVDLEAAFGRIDADGDGKIDESEAKSAAERMRAMGPGSREGFRRPEGLRAGRPAGERPGSGPGGEEAFGRLDRDGDGTLSREEFAEGMARMREFMRRGMPGPGGPAMPDRGGRGPEEGFRRPPPQN